MSVIVEPMAPQGKDFVLTRRLLNMTFVIKWASDDW